MTRKIVSLLCALALLASMVTIVATTITASAAEATFGNFSEGNYTLSRVIDGGAPVNTPVQNQGVIHDSTYGFGDVLVLGGSASQTRTITVTDNTTYDLTSYVLSSPVGNALPMLILISSAVRSPIWRLYTRFMWFRMQSSIASPPAARWLLE